MPRLIDAEKLGEYKASGISKLTEWQKGWNDAIDTIMNEAPTVETESVRHGHWCVTQAYPHTVYCSECFQRFAQAHWAVWEDGSLPRDYCPNCGAKMDESTMGQVKPSDKEFTLYADDKPIVTFKDSKIVLHGERREDDT